MRRPVQLTVQLSPGSGGDASDEIPVTGTVRVEDGPEHAFVGWVNLMALLHDAVVPAQAG